MAVKQRETQGATDPTHEKKKADAYLEVVGSAKKDKKYEK